MKNLQKKKNNLISITAETRLAVERPSFKG